MAILTEQVACGEATGIAALAHLKVAAQDGPRLLKFESGSAIIVARGEHMVAAELRMPFWRSDGVVGSTVITGAEALAVFGALWGRLRGRYEIFRCFHEVEGEFSVSIDGAILASCIAIDQYHES